jgi:hypothetical protein
LWLQAGKAGQFAVRLFSCFSITGDAKLEVRVPLHLNLHGKHGAVPSIHLEPQENHQHRNKKRKKEKEKIKRKIKGKGKKEKKI